MDRLLRLSNEKIARIGLDHIRSFYERIDWTQKMVGIRGARGVGKTTVLLQHLKKEFGIGERALYVSADHLFFAENKLYDLASEFSVKGGKLLIIDEAHRYPGWTKELKNIYDDILDLKIIFTGSSLLELNKAKADLSRRAVMYDMPGLSFREFLGFETQNFFDPIGISDLVKNHLQFSADIITQIKPLEFFDNYLKYGYYPFYLEGLSSFDQKLTETIQTVLEIDIPQTTNIQVSHIQLLKKLLQIISTSAPFQPNQSSLSSRTGITTNTLKSYLYYLHQAEMISLLQKPYIGINSLNKPAKIFLNNSNIMFNLGSAYANTGSIRETFFHNQLAHHNEIYSHKSADFQTVDGLVFEIGGPNKKKHQIRDLDNGYIAKDLIEMGSGNTIPLWMFGFLY